MAGSKSNYLENKLLDLVLGGVAFSSPATLYLAAFTVAPDDSGGGTEVTGGSYARAAVTNNLTNFPSASDGIKQNATAITFPTATANWGSIVALGIFDAATDGNLLYWATITPKTISDTDTLSIPIANLTVSEE